MNIQDLILITITIPMVFITGILLMLNHEYKKTLRRSEKNRWRFGVFNHTLLNTIHLLVIYKRPRIDHNTPWNIGVFVLYDLSPINKAFCLFWYIYSYFCYVFFYFAGVFLLEKHPILYNIPLYVNNKKHNTLRRSGKYRWMVMI